MKEGSEFGHEMVSEIIEIGNEVPSEIKIGMIVGIKPYKCKKSRKKRVFTMRRFFSIYVIEDAKLNHNLFEMRKNVPLEISALMELMSVGRHGAFKVNPKKEDNIVVLGAGAKAYQL